MEIFDDKGNDVTPRLIKDYVRMNIKDHHENEKSMSDIANKESEESSISDKSMIGTRNLTTATSNMVHTGTLFSTG